MFLLILMVCFFSPNANTPFDNNTLNGQLPPGATVTQSGDIVLPFSPAQTPYLTMKIDADEAVDETDESNNFAWLYKLLKLMLYF